MKKDLKPCTHLIGSKNIAIDKGGNESWEKNTFIYTVYLILRKIVL